MKTCLLITIGCLAACSPAADPNPRTAKTSMIDPIALEADQFTLYSIDTGTTIWPLPAPVFSEKFHGHGVFGKIEIAQPSERRELLDALDAAMNEEANSGSVSECFSPRHGIRAVRNGETIDYLICFECHRVRVLKAGDDTGMPLSGAPADLFNGYLTRAGVRLAE